MSLCYPLPVQYQGVKSVKIDDVYLKQFPDILEWLSTLSGITMHHKKNPPKIVKGILYTGLTQPKQVKSWLLLYNPMDVTDMDIDNGYKDYGWRNKIQNGVMFTPSGDNIKFLFRDGIIYSTFSDVLVGSCSSMDNVLDLDKYLIFLTTRKRGFVDAQNLFEIKK